MKFEYSRENLAASDQLWQRIFEILPGLTSWTILICMTTLSILIPKWAAILMIAFYFYWLLRLLYMTIFLVLSNYRLRGEAKTDWMKRIQGIDRVDDYIKDLAGQKTAGNLKEQLSLKIHLNELNNLKNNGKLPPHSKDIYHVIIYPVVKETKEIIESGISSLNHQHFPPERILIVYALEGRAADPIKEGVWAVERKYKKEFLDVLTVVHPSDLPGEARVKGANVTFAAKEVTKYLSAKQIPFENIIVSCFDADTVVGPNYLPCLTYSFMVTPNRLQSSYQPIPVYHNNIWEVPSFARVIESGSSFFQLIEATNPETLVTFSSHSMSFSALVNVNYWPVDMISDDSAIYWKSLIHYDGNYQVVPMYVTLSMDIVSADNIFKTAKNVYKQKRRWAWGVENFPIVMRAFLKMRAVSLSNKLRWGLKLFEGHVSWSTWGFLLSFIGWMPTLIARGDYSSSVIYYTTPGITATIFRLASVSLIASIAISISLLPKKKVNDPLKKKILHGFEWLMIPFILVFFSALPALDAQTRLMLGRRMEFWVTDKRREKK